MIIHRHVWEIKYLTNSEYLNYQGKPTGNETTQLSCICPKCGRVRQFEIKGYYKVADFKDRIYVP